MNFSFHRFILLLKMQLAVNRRLYLLGMLAMAGLLLVYMFFRAANGTFGFEFEAQEENYELSLMLLSIVFGSLIFRQLDNKKQRTQALMLPVSALERLGVAFLMAFVVFPLVYTLIFFSCNALVNQADVHLMEHPNKLYLFNGDNEQRMLFAMYMILPVVLLCAVWFRKLTLVKTVVMLCVPMLVFTFINSSIGKILISSVTPVNAEEKEFMVWNSTPFESMTIME